MMYLRTGTPGAGKTLSTIDEVDRRAKKEGRDVYYTNIKDVKLSGWFELKDGDKWHDEIPDNAIYFCDEFYEIFPKLGTSAKRPEHYTLLAKHRHRGLDVYLVCQGTQQIDDFLKPLFENHYHLIRSELADQSKVFRSQGFINSPHLKSARRDLETKTYRFNKKLYGMYHSATQNTHIKRIPRAYIYFLISFLFLGLMVWYVLSFFGERTKDVEPTEEKSTELSTDKYKGKTLFPAYDDDTDFNPIISYKPRINNMPETAPAYDELRKAKTFPRPQCISSGSDCKCYTQQATLMVDYPKVLCFSYIKNGRFEPTREDVSHAPRRGRKRERAKLVQNKNSGNDEVEKYN